MNRNTHILGVIALSTTIAATTALATNSVENIDVEADLTAVQNVEAAQVWRNIGPDLESAIAERLSAQIAEDGAEVRVDIDEVSLANMFTQSAGAAESRLVGDVEIDAPGLFNEIDYTLTVTADQAVAYYPSGTTPGKVTVDSKVYYTAMLAAFADNIAQKLDQ